MLNKKIILLAILTTYSNVALTSEAEMPVDATPDLTIDYKVWFQDHETIGKRYVSAQNNLIKITAHTQNGFIPSFFAQIGKAESNLFGYVNSDFRAFYVYKYSESLSLDYGLGFSMRYKGLHGKQGDAASLEWSAYDPHIAIGLTYTLASIPQLSFFGAAEKRFNKSSSSFLGGTTAELGTRFAFVRSGKKSITAEIGYRRDVQDFDFTVTKTIETPSEDEKTNSSTGKPGSTYTVVENRRMISDGLYLAVKVAF